MEKRGNKKTIFIVILVLLVLGLAGYIIYDKFIKEDPNITLQDEIKSLKDEIKDLNKEDVSVTEFKLKSSAGTYASISYTEDSAFYSEANNSGTLKTSEINLDGQKIKEAKIMNGVYTTDVAEAAVFIMSDGTVKYAYQTTPIDGSETKIAFENYGPLEGVKVSKINSINYSAGDKSPIIVCDVVLEDGTQKIIKK